MSLIKSEFLSHGSEVVHKTSQPTEGLILERNAELRKNEGVIQDLGAQSGETWGRMVASIPMIVYEKAIRDGYQLNCPDAEIAGREMQKFLQTPEGQMCLVRSKI